MIRSPRDLSFVIFGTLAISLLVHCSSNEQQLTQAKTPPVKNDSFQTVKLLFAGDIMMHMPQINAAEDSAGRYDFSSVFEKVSPIISSADIAVANIETTFGGKPYTGYPQFSAPDTLAWFMKQAGFDMIVTANNHTCDRGKKGIIGTIETLDRYGFEYTGSFRNQEEKERTYPLIIEKNGMKIAFLNYTYGTNGLPVPDPLVVNHIDTVQIRKDIQAARQKNADAVIAIFHWGLEYKRDPGADQKLIAKFTLEHGADAVIGAHPHVLQPAVWESYTLAGDSVERKGLVVYSLGNFISNQRDRYRDGGMLFELTVKRNRHTKKLTIENAGFYPTWVYIQPWPKKYYILPASEYETDSTFIRPKESKAIMMQFLEDTREHLVREGARELR